MSTKFRKVLSILTAAVMLLGTTLISPVFASGETAVTYQTVDISQSYNSMAYIDSQNVNTEITINTDNDFWRTGGPSYYSNYALSGDDVEALKDENGLVYDKTGIPFYWNTSGAAGVSGNDESKQSGTNYVTSVSVEVPDGKYSKLHFLAHMIANEASWKPFYVEAIYTDGTKVSTNVDIYAYDYDKDNAIVLGQYDHFNAGKNETVKFSTYRKAAAAVHTYTVNLDSSKTLQSLRFYNKGTSNYANWYEQTKVLAVTFEGDFLTAKIDALPDEADITASNAYSVKKLISEIEDIMKVSKLTVNDLSDLNAQKLTAVKAKTDEVIRLAEATTEYKTVDISAYYKGKAYLNSQNYTSVTIDSDDDFWSWGGDTYRHNYALNSESVEALKVNGLVYDNGGIPFLWNTDGAIQVRRTSSFSPGATYTNGATVDIENGSYSKIDFLAYSVNGSKTYQAFTVDMIYTDGTVTKSVYINGMGATTEKAIKVGAYAHWAENANKGSTVTNFGSAGTAAVDTYSVQADETKTLDKIRFYNGVSDYAGGYEQTKVLALTLEKDRLKAVLTEIPEASEITVGNVQSVKTALENFYSILDAQNKTVSDLTADEQAKVTAAAEKVEAVLKEIKADDTYKTIDISGYYKGKAYLNSQNYTSVTIDSDDDFWSWGGDKFRHNYALNSDSVEALKVNGLVYDNGGIPFLWNTDGAIQVRRSSSYSPGAVYTNGATVDIEDGNYSKINFLAYSVNGTTETNNKFMADMIYTDGTTVSQYVHINGMGNTTENAVNVGAYAHWTENANKGSTVTNFGSAGTAAVDTYSIQTDETRTLDKIKFYNTDNYHGGVEQVKVLALTLSNDGINSHIDKLLSSDSITADNALEVKKAVWAIEAEMTEKGVAEADLTETRQSKLTTVREACQSVLSGIYSDVIADGFTLTTQNNTDGSVTATAKGEFVNFFTEDKKATVIMGLYDGEKLVKNVQLRDFTLDADSITPFSETFTAENFDNLKNGKIRAIILSGISDMKPLCGAKEYKRQSGITGALNSNIKYTGRWEATSEGMKSHWSGAYAETIFTGNSISAVLSDNETNLYAEIDGTKTLYENVSGVVNLTPTALNGGDHTLKIYGQSIEKNIEILGFKLDEGAELKSSANRKVLIEFIGDSITAGQQSGYVDVTAAYSWKTCADSNVDRVIVAQSGLTLVPDSNYWWSNGMSTQYFKLDGDRKNGGDTAWNTASYSPDIIVINIGTNDQGRIWQTASPTDITYDKLQSTMADFLKNLRNAHQNAEIFVMKPLTVNMQTDLSNAVTNANDSKIHWIDTTDWVSTEDDCYDGLHPTDSAHTKIAEKLTAILTPYIAD